MGLDMYIFTRQKNAPDKSEPREMCYWRKANQIRRWFVDHTGYDPNNNCVEHPLTKENLEDLLADCRKIINDRSLETCMKEMPTMEGFFFGSTDYDNMYYDDIQSTIRQVEELLRDTNFETEEVFYYEWY